MTGSAAKIKELERQLKVANYDRHWAEQRLADVRAHRDEIIRLLDTPTLTEHLNEGGTVFSPRRIAPR